MSDLTPERIAELKRIAEASLLFDADDITKLVVLTQPDVLALLAALTAERERAEEAERWVSDLQSGMYINCVYCGYRYGPQADTPVAMADVLKAHVEKCPKHPLSKALAECDALREQVERLREAMGEEWSGISKNWCPECRRSKDFGHDALCTRGRFFAAPKEAQ